MNLSDLIDNADNISLAAQKMIKLKKGIIKRLSMLGEATIAELSAELAFSIPTVTKIISELIKEEIIFETGKMETSGGRKPKQFGINPAAGYYLGIEVNRNSVSIGIQNFKNNFIKLTENINYKLENTLESLDDLCNLINRFIEDLKIEKKKIVSACVNLSGRINSTVGFSYNYFYFEEKPLSEIIESKINIKTFLENDTRAMAYGEYNYGVVEKEKNVIFLNIGLGVGIGIIIDGKLYYGKSGFSGEFGHSPVFDNEIICQCGKKGCLETETSGIALERKFKDKLQQGYKSILSGKKSVDEIIVDDILKAVIENGDTLAIEIINEIGNHIGRYLSILINIFNPELIVIGGILANTDVYIRLPIKSAVHKYSISLVGLDMEMKMSSLGSKAGVVGACCILRDKLFYGA
jgi:predicted NBD/HSP70 family sugar kinase